MEVAAVITLSITLPYSVTWSLNNYISIYYGYILTSLPEPCVE